MPIHKSCSKFKRKKIEKWIERIDAMLESKKCPIPKKLRDRLIKKKHSVTIRCCRVCRSRSGGKLKGKRRGNTVYICNIGFRIAVFFHELIHACGGREIDAEAFENTCFKRKDGAKKPTASDWDKFINETTDWNCLRVGTFIIWDPKTGKKWVNAGTKRKPKKGKALKKNPKTPKRILKKLAKK